MKKLSSYLLVVILVLVFNCSYGQIDTAYFNKLEPIAIPDREIDMEYYEFPQIRSAENGDHDFSDDLLVSVLKDLVEIQEKRIKQLEDAINLCDKLSELHQANIKMLIEMLPEEKRKQLHR